MGECGTYAGYQKHMVLGTPTCALCRDAATEYQRQWRAAHPEKAARNAARQRLRQRALRILGLRHSRELREIITDLSGAEHG